MILKVAFRKWIFIRDKELFFTFNIGALEYATEKIMKIDLWQIGEEGEYDINLALLYAGYYVACMERFKKPKYKIGHAAVWLEYMSGEEKQKFAQGVADLMGKMTKSKKKVKSPGKS